MELFCLFTANSWWSCYVCLQRAAGGAVLFVYSEQLMDLFCLFTVNSWWSCFVSFTVNSWWSCFVCLQWTANGAVSFVYIEQLIELFCLFTVNSWWSCFRRALAGGFLVDWSANRWRWSNALEKRRRRRRRSRNLRFVYLKLFVNRQTVKRLKTLPSHNSRNQRFVHWRHFPVMKIQEILNRLENSGKLRQILFVIFSDI